MAASITQVLGMSIKLAGVIAALAASACSPVGPDTSSGSVEAFEKHVRGGPIGAGSDYWLQLLNSYGEWENAALVFGYYTAEGTLDECEHMVGGLKRANPGREYRCAPANLDRR